MIEVKNLSISLGGHRILKNISFKLGNRENLVILGRSGSGKTVLTKSLLGLFPPDDGSIVVDSVDLYRGSKIELKKIRESFAMVFQHAALLDSFTVYQNVALPLYERGILDESVIKERVLRSLQLVGLEETIDLYPAELSGGMRKRIGIARALVYEPEYLIFDEPVSGLDPITAAETLFYIEAISKTQNASILTITHDLHSLPRLGNQVLFMDNGEMLYYGAISEITKVDDDTIRRYFQA